MIEHMMDEPMAQTIEGTIKSGGSNGTVTFEDGTKLAIPKTVLVPKDQLKPGAVIVAEYTQKGSRKIATSVQVKSDGGCEV